VDLVQYLARRGQRLCEYGCPVGDIFRYGVEVARRQADILGQCTIPSPYAQGCAGGTVGGPPSTTCVAHATGGIDFAHHPPTHELRIVSFLNHTHELVAENTLVLSVATYDFQIGIADPGQGHPYASFTRRWARKCIVVGQPDLSAAL
jgi:hypothetical protein